MALRQPGAISALRCTGHLPARTTRRTRRDDETESLGPAHGRPVAPSSDRCPTRPTPRSPRAPGRDVGKSRAAMTSINRQSVTPRSALWSRDRRSSIAPRTPNHRTAATSRQATQARSHRPRSHQKIQSTDASTPARTRCLQSGATTTNSGPTSRRAANVTAPPTSPTDRDRSPPRTVHHRSPIRDIRVLRLIRVPLSRMPATSRS